jgi:hypothetical protein
MQGAVRAALEASGVSGIAIEGIEPMWFLRFPTPEQEATFVRAAVREGVLFKRGPYNFACLAHDEDALHEIEAAANAAFIAVREAGGA